MGVSATPSAFDRVLERIENVTGRRPRGTGDTVSALCAAHDDSNESCSVTRAPGQVLLHCFAGCTNDDIVAALGLELVDLFDEPRANGQTGSTIVATFDYVDEQGALLYQVVRKSGKQFRQRRPDGRGGWIWDMKGARRVLYNLQAVLEGVRLGHLIWVTEGEKDANAIARLGYTATCNAMGAGKWRDEYATVLAAANVTIVADRDEPGYAHAARVAASLRGVGAKVDVVEAKAGKDVSDHLAAGYELDDLVPVDVARRDQPADENREREAASDGRSGYEAATVDWSKFWATEHAEEDYACAPLLVRGRSHAAVSLAKAGKSLLFLEIAAKKATGQSVLAQPAGEPIDVLYCDHEMTDDDLKERLLDMGFGADTDLSHLHYVLLPSVPPLDTMVGGATLLEHVERIGAEMVFIDTTSRATRGPENDADTWQDYYRYTAQLLKAAGVTQVRLDHLGKDKQLGARGSSAKNDDVDIVWQLERNENGITATSTFKRLGWVEHKVALAILEDPLRHVPVAQNWPAGTSEVARSLEEARVPIGASRRQARQMLKDAGLSARNDVLGAALRWRLEQAEP